MILNVGPAEEGAGDLKKNPENNSKTKLNHSRKKKHPEKKSTRLSFVPEKKTARF